MKNTVICYVTIAMPNFYQSLLDTVAIVIQCNTYNIYIQLIHIATIFDFLLSESGPRK